MSRVLSFQHFYFVGIKGVALTALAQCLLDAGKSVRGSDVAEKFVTQKILDDRSIQIDTSFDVALPLDTECVIYTAAHNAQQNPQVIAAKSRNIPTFSHAEALGDLFNDSQGMAVCGVGGKSTTSAMITWILEKLEYQPNFAIGVGNIPGLERTGQWSAQATYFVAEADEYVIDPSAPSRHEEITPRYSFMNPYVTVCTNLKHDHPDVYPTFEDTKKHYGRFFNQIKDNGTLVASLEDRSTIESLGVWQEHHERQMVWFGEDGDGNNQQLTHGNQGKVFLLDTQTFSSQDGQTSCVLNIPHLQFSGTLTLKLPGLFNLRNAVAAIAACSVIGVEPSQAIASLASFHSTLRRSQFVGEKHGVKYYDDYAHHPHEVKNIVHAFREWFPEHRLVVAFQSHTFSRTKQFFADFVDAFTEASELVMIDIFPSAREAFDSTVSSDQLCETIHQKYPQLPAKNLKTLDQLARFCETELHDGDIFLTVGAGDIYQVYDRIR